jgi:hypothetical protein
MVLLLRFYEQRHLHLVLMGQLRSAKIPIYTNSHLEEGVR